MERAKALLLLESSGSPELVGALHADIADRYGGEAFKTRESWRASGSPDAQRAFVATLETALGARLRRGEEADTRELEALFDDKDLSVAEDAADALGRLYAEKIGRGLLVDVARFEAALKGGSGYKHSAAAFVLGRVYPALFERGEAVDVPRLENWLKTDNPALILAGIKALGPIYATRIRRGETVNLEAFKKLMKSQYYPVLEASAEAWGLAHAAMVERGLNIETERVESILKEHTLGSIFQPEVWTPIYEAQLKRGERMLAGPFSDRGGASGTHRRASADRRAAKIAGTLRLLPEWRDEGPFSSGALTRHADPEMRNEFRQALNAAHARMLKRGETVDPARLDGAESVAVRALYAGGKPGEPLLSENALERYRLWNERRLPFDADMVEQYLSAENPRAWLLELESRANALLEEGFDPDDRQARWTAFVGVRMRGVDATWEEFEVRIAGLRKFDARHPGSFRSLFGKARGMRSFEVSGLAREPLDVRRIDSVVLKKHVESLLSIEQRIKSLEWIADFPDVKAFQIQGLYYQLKRRQAERGGSLAAGERFHVPFPSPEAMREELEANPRLLYPLAFKLARDRLGDPRWAERLRVLMRDLIVAEMLLDEGTRGALTSGDSDRALLALQNFHEDYRMHLPNSVGLQFDAIKGLGAVWDELSRDVRSAWKGAEEPGTASKKTTYRFVPQGFLSVFRGRAGIHDCSFYEDDDMGIAYTRAMHEDTLYYFVYKGQALKGYVGLLTGRDARGEKILTIDTINSPSIDGKELLTGLLRELAERAEELGAAGIALPADLQAFFNFTNKTTLLKMRVFRKAKNVRVKPLHARSWARFTKMFGQDTHNSIEEGRFKLIDLNLL